MRLMAPDVWARADVAPAHRATTERGRRSRVRECIQKSIKGWISDLIGSRQR